MSNIKRILVSFEKSDMDPMYKLKSNKDWTWEQLIIETSKFYLNHNPINVEEDFE